MYKIIPFNIPIKVVSHSHVTPPAEVNNLALIKKVPHFSKYPDKHLEKVIARLNEGYGFDRRFLSKMPWDPLRPDQETSEGLGLKSAKAALQNTSCRPEILLHGSTTTSRYTGSQATSIAGGLGLNVPSYETKAGCSTGLALLHMAYSFLGSSYDSALCVFAETLSKVASAKDSESWFGLADGAASLFLQKVGDKEESHFTVKKSVFTTEGKFIDLYSTHGVLPPIPSDIEEGKYALQGDADELKKQAFRHYIGMIEAILNPSEKKCIDWIFCHQVNRQIVSEFVSATGVAGQPYWINHEYGNLGGASIPFAISHALNKKVIKRGDNLLLISVGGGLSAAAQIWKCNQDT